MAVADSFHFKSYSRDLERGLISDGFLNKKESDAYTLIVVIRAIRRAVVARRMFVLTNKAIIQFDRRYEDLLRVKYLWEKEIGLFLISKHLTYADNPLQLNVCLPVYSNLELNDLSWMGPEDDCYSQYLRVPGQLDPNLCLHYIPDFVHFLNQLGESYGRLKVPHTTSLINVAWASEILRQWLFSLEERDEVLRDPRSILIAKISPAHPVAHALKTNILHAAQLKSLVWKNGRIGL